MMIEVTADELGILITAAAIGHHTMAKDFKAKVRELIVRFQGVLDEST